MSKTKDRQAKAGQATEERVEDVSLATELKARFSDYAAAVVISRAIADVRDGLKPVHRRILYSMKIGRYDWSGPYRKSAKIVGDCMGTFHPHGDSSIYDAMARLTQTWSVNAPLIDGQGNFGSPDGDAPAAMRYTEARLAPIARHMLEEIGRGTIDYRPNYDNTTQEPTVLPVAFPNVLVNGGDGIAVGIASSVAPHHLGEVISATRARLASPESSLEEIMTHLPGPDFPTAGRILGRDGIEKAYRTGRGTLLLEATTDFEMQGRTPVIVYSDMPYGKTRARLLAKINEIILASQPKKTGEYPEEAIPDIVSARDETDRHGPRFVVELRPGADAEAIDRLLKARTDLRVTVSLNFTLLDNRGVPREMGLLDILDEWLAFRRATVTRRTRFDLIQARDRGRLLLGRLAALSIIDKVIKMIRASDSREAARSALLAIKFRRADFDELLDLMGKPEQLKGRSWSLSPEQADDILSMQLARLTGLERESLAQDIRKLADKIAGLREILSDRVKLDAVIDGELAAIAKEHIVGERKTQIVDAPAEVLSPVAASVSDLPCQIWMGADARLGRALEARDMDMPGHWISSSTASRLLAFSDAGTAYGLDVSALPVLDDKTPPRPWPGLLGLSPDGEIISCLSFAPGELAKEAGRTLCFVSADGMVRRNLASDFEAIPAGGKLAMKIESGDAPLSFVLCERADDQGGALFLGTAQGRVIRFALSEVRIMGSRASRGVRGMKLAEGDRIVSALELPDQSLSAELTDEVEAGWLGKTRLKHLSTEARPLIEGPELVQIAASGHARRTLMAAYRQTRRDNRGINDRGPAKTIGHILGYRIMNGPDQTLTAFTGEDFLNDRVEIRLDDVRRGGRATTGSVATGELIALDLAR